MTYYRYTILKNNNDIQMSRFLRFFKNISIENKLKKYILIRKKYWLFLKNIHLINSKIKFIKVRFNFKTLFPFWSACLKNLRNPIKKHDVKCYTEFQFYIIIRNF